MTYTYEQVMTYEVARELINSHIADCSEQLGIEHEKAQPNVKRIEKLIAMQQVIFLERESMVMTDDAAMRAVIAKFRREPIRRAIEAATD